MAEKVEMRALPLAELRESPLNTRKHFNEKRMAELTASVCEKGVLTPILVRSQNGFYEIAAGARRYRAAKAAGLERIPAVIRKMDDPTFLEVLMIENLQREDVHPLEEANGYRQLMEARGYDVETLAAKIGKSVSYVYQRLKLAELIPAAQKALWDEKITAGHAILIARLGEREQAEALEACLQEWREGISVRELADHIRSEIMRDLHSASFNKKDASLVPEAGDCISCAKRTGYTPALFPDIEKKDTCTDPVCFKAKLEAHLAAKIAAATRDGVEPLRLTTAFYTRTKDVLHADKYVVIKKGDKRCEHARAGVVVEGQGGDVGKTLTVCADEKCKVHHGAGSRSGVSAEHRARMKRDQEKAELEEAVRQRTFEAVLAVDRGLNLEEKRLLVEALIRIAWAETARAVASHHGLKPVKGQFGKDYESPLCRYLVDRTDRQLDGLLIELVLHRMVAGFYGIKNQDYLKRFAALRGVDMKKIGRAVKAELKAEKEKKKNPAKRGTRGAGSSAKGAKKAKKRSAKSK